jgi:hypothetical protein
MPRIAISAFDAMMGASSSTRAFRARADEVIPQGAFAAVHESESGTKWTFGTHRLMSVFGVKWTGSVATHQSKLISARASSARILTNLNR